MLVYQRVWDGEKWVPWKRQNVGDISTTHTRTHKRKDDIGI